MPIDHHYRKDERLIMAMAVGLGLAVGILAFVLSSKLSPSTRQVAPDEVWTYISTMAPKAGLDPEFVYAIAWAESSLNSKARSSVARGMMQLTQAAWQEVTEESYRKAWDWQTNVRVGIDYLAHCRDFLKKRGEFTYPLLAASYRYGPYYVQDKDFKIGQMNRPQNEIYKRIFKGDVRPVAPPAS